MSEKSPRKRATKKTTTARPRKDTVAQEAPREPEDQTVADPTPPAVDEPVALVPPPMAATEPTYHAAGASNLPCVTCGGMAVVIADFPWTADKPAFCRNDCPPQYRFLLDA